MGGDELQSIRDVSVVLPSVSEVLNVLTFQAGFNSSLVIVGTTLLGIAAGVIGTFALLRKRALMGDALAHSALPGLAATYLLAEALGFEGKQIVPLLIGAAVSGILGVVSIHCLGKYTRLQEEAAIGAVLSSFFGVGVVLLSAVQYVGSSGGLGHFIYGQTAAMQQFDAVLLACVALVVCAAALLLFKEFSLVCFDPDYAKVGGWPVGAIDLLLMALVTVVTVIGLQAVGMILIVALLIVPPAAARFWTESLPRMIALSMTFGGLSGYFGSAASSLLPRLPAGSIIVLTAGGIFVVSFLFAPERGVLASFRSQLLLRMKIITDHFLRDFYETTERCGTLLSNVIPLKDLSSFQRLSITRRIMLAWWISMAGLGKIRDGKVSLSSRGMENARRLTRSHRLWEEYLQSYTDLLPSHLDYSADFVEHSLSPAIIRNLEEKLAVGGRLDDLAEVPKSLHSIPLSNEEGK